MQVRALGMSAGMVVAVGLVGAGPAAAQSGSLDPSFGSGGKVLAATGNYGGDNAILQPNGDIVVSVGEYADFAVARFLPSGKLDSSFGHHGVATAAPATIGGQSVYDANSQSLALQSNGDIVVGGVVSSQLGSSGFGVVRFTSTGAIDGTFGSGGGVATAISTGLTQAPALLVQSNGDILVGGWALQASYRSDTITGSVARYTPSGRLDPTFGSGGITSSASLGGVTTIGVDASGDAFVLPGFAELSPAGALDSSVTQEPIVNSSAGGPAAFLSNGNTVQAQTVGVGKHNTEVDAQQFAANGTLDSAFSSPMLHYVAGMTAQDSAGAIAVEPNGQIVFGGSHFFATSVFGLARVNSNGNIDPPFGTGGVVTTDFQGDDGIDTLLTQPNGDIVAVGDSEDNSTGVTDVAMARYLP